MAFPPAIDGLLSALAASGAGNSGEVALTDEIKTQMNKMGQDYLFFTLPEVEWGRFTSDTYPDSAPGWAVNYILFTWMGVFGTFPDSVPAEQAEARIRQLFATRDDAALPARQPYNKFVNFSNGVYSLVPTSYSQDTFVYNCTPCGGARKPVTPIIPRSATTTVLT